MARDVDSLALCMQALLCDHMFSLDPTLPPIPFNTQVCSEKYVSSAVGRLVAISLSLYSCALYGCTVVKLRSCISFEKLFDQE